jgi:hypothetical protein
MATLGRCLALGTKTTTINVFSPRRASRQRESLSSVENSLNFEMEWELAFFFSSFLVGTIGVRERV